MVPVFEEIKLNAPILLIFAIDINPAFLSKYLNCPKGIYCQ